VTYVIGFRPSQVKDATSVHAHCRLTTLVVLHLVDLIILTASTATSAVRPVFIIQFTNDVNENFCQDQDQARLSYNNKCCNVLLSLTD